MGVEQEELVDDLLAAPVGVTLLAALEAERRPPSLDAPQDCDPRAVDEAVAMVERMPFGALAAMAVSTGEWRAGPWTSGAVDDVASAYAHAEGRRPLARAVARTFAEQLLRPVDRMRQEWWHPAGAVDQHLFADLERVYGNGELTFGGLWTVTDPPGEAHDALVSAWELYPGPVSRWHIPATPTSRVWELRRPADWVDLVARYPKVAPREHGGWELPGPNQHLTGHRLLDLPQQRAARTSVTPHVLPDWTAVAADFDGVHLTWAGFITSEGFVSDLPGRGVTMLRYWASERTLWLSDVFGTPTPLPAPSFRDAHEGVDVRADALRRERDHTVLTSFLRNG